MIYPEIRVPIPDMGGYTRRRGSVVYSYVYIGDRQTTTDGGTTHPKSKCIGRIELVWLVNLVRPSKIQNNLSRLSLI